MTPRLDYRDALRLMFKPGHRLTQTNGRRGPEYFVVPGGPVTDATARRILDHRLCHKDDPGLFPEAPQSWSLLTSAASDT